MTFGSKLSTLGPVEFPAFTGSRVMHMPFLTREPAATTPNLPQYAAMLTQLCADLPTGVGYVTVDEAELRAGEHHRRPGLHVDGVDELGRLGPWGGGGGYGARGLVCASTHVGCRAWDQAFWGSAGKDGDCEHLRPQCGKAIYLQPNVAYAMGGLTVHESVPVQGDCRRQFIRVSLPSESAWYEGYTESPVGVKPPGETRPRRPGMEYRP